MHPHAFNTHDSTTKWFFTCCKAKISGRGHRSQDIFKNLTHLWYNFIPQNTYILHAHGLWDKH